ncbi:MAG: WecB/TagA/CpsF family glycosyltransferase [Planctomycetes bacterium]|nr:WecB/TagA/CpsF family glycosyltransferase [Planctomycetota bacterium]
MSVDQVDELVSKEPSASVKSIDWPAAEVAIDEEVNQSQAQASSQAYEILGVRLLDVTFDGAVALLESLLIDEPGEPMTLYSVNSQALNLAARDLDFRRVLNEGDYVFAEGAAVRWAARLQGKRLRANLNGEELIPALLHATADQGYRYYMLGGSPESVRRTAQLATQMFPGWELAGFHHGYLHAGNRAAALRDINRHRPHLLLVGMGSPVQERWIHDHRDLLDTRVCAAVGTMFGYRAGEKPCGDTWIRRAGYGSLPAFVQQPEKLRRQIASNSALLSRIAWAHCVAKCRRRFSRRGHSRG